MLFGRSMQCIHRQYYLQHLIITTVQCNFIKSGGLHLEIKLSPALLILYMFKHTISKMEKILKPLGCEVRGVDLKIENRPEGKSVALL